MAFGHRKKTNPEIGRVREIGSLPKKSEVKAMFYQNVGFGRIGDPQSVDGTEFPSWMSRHPVGKLVIEGRIGVPTCYVTGAELPFHPDGDDKQDWNPSLIAVNGFHYRADQIIVASAISYYAENYPAFAFEEARKVLQTKGLYGKRGRQTIAEALRALKAATLPKKPEAIGSTVREQQAALASAFPQGA